MMLRCDSEGVGANLVGSVAIRGNAVSPDNDGIDFATRHQCRSRAVRYERGRQTILHQLVSRQPGTCIRTKRLEDMHKAKARTSCLFCASMPSCSPSSLSLAADALLFRVPFVSGISV